MGEPWKEKYKVEYSSASDENIDSWVQKYIGEISRIYTLLDRVRSNDETTGEPDDTVPWQWHVDHAKKTLYLRNVADTAWIPVCTLNAAGTRFVFDQVVANNGGLPSVQYGLIASRPAEEVDGAVYVATDEGKRYRWNATTKAWDYIDTLVLKNSSGEIIGSISGNAKTADLALKANRATEADHATAATNAAYAETVGNAEYSDTTGKLKTPIAINGIPFDGSHDIHIPTGTGGDADVSAYESLLWRTGQLEREISNIELAQEDANIFPDYNNLLVENFKSTADIDQTAVLVTSSAAGDDSLNVASLSSLRAGAMYMLTDGTLSEYVTVKGLVKNGTTYRVVLTAVIKNVYKDSTAYLYRTTSKVANGKATGSGVTSSVSYAPTLVWSGEGTSTPGSTKLNTTTDNAASFTGDSGVIYTSDGLVTMNPVQTYGIAMLATGGQFGTWATFIGKASDN